MLTYQEINENGLYLDANNPLQNMMPTIPQKFLESALNNLNSPCLYYRQGHTFGFVTYKRLLNLVENLTMSLKQLGVKRGDRIAILSENRPEWVVSDLSVLSHGAIFVPLHTSLSSNQIRNMINDLEPKIIIISEKRMLAKLIQIKKDISRHIILLFYNIDLVEDLSEFKNDACHFIEALRMNPHKNFSSQYRQLITEKYAEDTACIIYTLRPNGRYVGAELTHDNLVSNYESTYEAFPVGPQDKLLSVLPLSHAFERTAGYYLPLLSGSSIVYPPNMSSIAKIMKEHKPTVIMGVPYIYEKINHQIISKVSESHFRKLIFTKGLNFAFNIKDKKNIIYKIYNKIVYEKVRDTLGGNIRALISGGAPLGESVAKFYEACNIPILQGYGMTELSPIVSFNREQNNKLGTVGKPLAAVRVKIADDGEILVKSPGVMKGYYNNEAETKSMKDKDGWIRTGDIGELDNEGFLILKGLKKDLIVLCTGKKVSPFAIEKNLLKSDYINHAKVYSENQKTLNAKIVPDISKLKEKFSDLTNTEISSSKIVLDFIFKEATLSLKDLSHFEQIKKIQLCESL